MYRKTEKRSFYQLSYEQFSGIGKSEIAKAYIKKYHKEYNVVLMVNFSGSLCETIASDSAVHIKELSDEMITACMEVIGRIAGSSCSLGDYETAEKYYFIIHNHRLEKGEFVLIMQL